MSTGSRTDSLAPRRRVLWLGWGLTTMVGIQIIVVALRLLTGWPSPIWPGLLGATVTLPLGLVASTVPVLRRHTAIVVRSTVSAAGLTSLVVGIYVLVVFGTLGSPADEERTLLVASMAAAGVVGLLYGPARNRIEELANIRIYGDARAPDEALRTFGSRLSRAVPMDELLLQLVESLRKSMGLQRAEVWTGADGRFAVAVSVPHGHSGSIALSGDEQGVAARSGVSGNAWLEIWMPSVLAGRGDAQVRVAPCAHIGRLLGLIVVQRRGDDDPFSTDDESVLGELGRHVGIALHNVELDSALQQSLDELKLRAEELQASRARVVAAGDAERRRIERNIHDGAQQHLVALRVQLRLATDAVKKNPAAAIEMLTRLNDLVQDAVEELRALSHGIYPPLLRSGGLHEALPAAAVRAALPTTVDCEGIGRYPEEIEAAVYFCCMEAMQNAGKYAGDCATIRVRVSDADGALTFLVCDDGAGFETGCTEGGAGFVNMADRLGAVGGSVSVESSVGSGTSVIGTIPLPGG